MYCFPNLLVISLIEVEMSTLNICYRNILEKAKSIALIRYIRHIYKIRNIDLHYRTKQTRYSGYVVQGKKIPAITCYAF